MNLRLVIRVLVYSLALSLGGWAFLAKCGTTSIAPALACTGSPALPPMIPASGATNVPTNARIVFLPDGAFGGAISEANLFGPTGRLATGRRTRSGAFEILPPPLAPNVAHTVEVKATPRELESAKLTFTTAAGADTTAPKVTVLGPLATHPAAGEVRSDCSPSQWVTVRVKIEDESPTFAVLTIREGDKQRAAFANVLTEELRFSDYESRSPSDGQAARVPRNRSWTLVVVDAAGNRSQAIVWPGGAVSPAPSGGSFFEPPYPELTVAPNSSRCGCSHAQASWSDAVLPGGVALALASARRRRRLTRGSLGSPAPRP